ncbi:sodium-dependent multivitamin transporter-like isoform X2 [Ptychodera flava]|uniref:sodium-dependent multivitamin transporter-like isoform X2 n=1 Tax=Ptychodera flava TaxID=63121 RepID=UPI003969C3DC
MSTEATPFGVVDYVVFSAMLGVSLVTGIYHGVKSGQRSGTSEFLVADKSMNCLPVAMSLSVSFLSALTILGMSAEIFIYDATYSFLVLSYLWLMPTVMFLFVPVFHGLNLISAYEYFGLRFNYAVRITAALLFALQTIFYIAVTLIGPALAVEAVMGVDLWIMLIITGAVCVFYTTLGGMKAVIWTDVFQFLVIVGSLVTVIVLGTIEAGGLEKVWEMNKQDGRLDIFTVPLDITERTTMLSMIFGGGMNTFAFYISQTAVQRYASSKSLRHAQISTMLILPFQFVILPIVYLSGLVMYAYYNDYLLPLQPAVNATFAPEFPVVGTVDPKYTPDYTSSDQILVYFVSSLFGSISGIQGLFVAALFAGTLSSMSSGLNAMIAVTLEDVVKPWRRWRAARTQRAVYENDVLDTIVGKILTVVYGIIAIGLAYVASSLGTLVTLANTIFGTSGGPLLGGFTLGMYYKRANSWGTLIGILVGFGLGVWVSVGAIIYADNLDEVMSFYKLSFMWYSTFSFFCTMVIGVLCSELIRCLVPSERHKKIDPLLLGMFVRPKGTNRFRVVRPEDSEEDYLLKDIKGRADKAGKKDVLTIQDDDVIMLKMEKRVD